MKSLKKSGEHRSCLICQRAAGKGGAKSGFPLYCIFLGKYISFSEAEKIAKKCKDFLKE